MTVLFLCTGNYYRSRYAEVRFNALAEERGLAWRAASRGLDVDFEQKHNIGPLSPDAVARLTALALIDQPAATRMPRALEPADLEAAGRVIALQRDEHYPMMVEAFPDWAERVEYWDVHDRPPGEDYDPMQDVEGKLDTLIGELSADPAGECA